MDTPNKDDSGTLGNLFNKYLNTVVVVQYIQAEWRSLTAEQIPLIPSHDAKQILLTPDSKLWKLLDRLVGKERA